MTRLALPNRRRQETFDIHFEGFDYTVSVGLHGDGTPGEAFIQAHKLASPVEAVARDFAIVVSLAIQHGVPLKQIRDGVTRDRNGAPASVVGAVLDAMDAAQ